MRNPFSSIADALRQQIADDLYHTSRRHPAFRNLTPRPPPSCVVCGGRLVEGTCVTPACGWVR